MNDHYSGIVAALFLSFCLMTTTQAVNPVGSLDGWDGAALQGWAWDADQSGAFLSVDIYVDGPAGFGTLIGTAVANRARPDLTGPQAGHAFEFALPSAVDSRAIYAQAHNVGAGAAAQLPGSPQVVLGDRTEIWFGKAQPWVLGTSEEWELTKHNADVLLMFIDQINQSDINDLRNLVAMLTKYNIKIAVEMGGLVDWRASYGDQSGEESATIEMNKVKKLTDPIAAGGAGGTITYINFDGAIRRMLYPKIGGNPPAEMGYHTLETATDEFVDAVRMWKQRYPDVKIFALTNFPNWGWKGGPAYHNFQFSTGTQGNGNYFQVIQMIVQKTRAAGLPISGVTVDNPHDYVNYVFASNQPSVTAGVDWFARLLELEAYIESEGLDFNMIFNCSKGGTPGRGGTNQLFYEHSLEFINEYHAHGGTPGRYIMESWYSLPDIWVPESSPYSMANLAAGAVIELRAEPNPVGSPVGQVDQADWTGAAGWAVDYDTDEAVTVTFYLDGRPGEGIELGSMAATAMHTARGAHGFRYYFDPAVTALYENDGQAHYLYAVATNGAGEGGDRLLGGTPLPLAMAPASASRGAWSLYE